MKFNFLEFKNYRSYGDYTTRIDLNDLDATILIGENGSGKTSFIEAIIWCVYGRSLVNMDDVINRKSKKDCKVEVCFSIGNNVYSIIRFRKHSLHNDDLLFFKNKDDISKSKKPDTQALIEETIGINYNALVSSIIFSSEFYTSFLRSTQSTRLDIFENVLALQEIKKYSKIIKTFIDPIEENITETKTKDLLLNEKINNLNENINEYKERTKKNLIAIKLEKDKLEKDKLELESKIKRLESINIESEIKKVKEYEEIIKYNFSIRQQLSSIEKIDIQPLTTKLFEEKVKLEELKEISVNEELEKINKHNKIKNEYAINHLTMSSLKKDLIDVVSFEKEIEKNKKEISSLEKEKQKIIDDKNLCPTCGQEIKEDLTLKLISKKENDIKIKNEIIKNVNEKLEEAKIKNQEINIKIKNLDKNIIIPDNSKYEEEFLKNISNKIKKSEELIYKYQTEIEYKQKEKESIDKKVKELENSVKDVPEKPFMSIEDLSSLSVETNEIKKEIEAKNNNLNILSERAKTLYDKSYVEELNVKISELENAVVLVKKEIKNLENELNHYDFLYSLFSNKSFGVKKYIINKVIDSFNENINYYLPFFFEDEVEITFDKDLNDTILLNKKEVSFMSFSSGEKTRLDLAVSFALFMMAKTFFSSETNLLVFDEILDMNLDEKGVNSVLNIVDSLSKNNSVFVISHRDEYKEHFSKQLYISKEDGFSKMRQR
jgi:DNA repair exonuclease SbcCD ATPase subunit